MFGNYYEARNWLESFIPLTYTKSNLGLERIKYLLALLGNPHKKFKSIHVAGTSGKGSTALYIARLLQSSSRFTLRQTQGDTEHGRSITVHSSQKSPKVGLHISPHLVDLRERMQIFQGQNSKGSLMPTDQFLKLMDKMRKIVEKIKKEKPDLTPSYFEILVAASFLYFAQEKVDWAVVEVGLGGRLDATNVLKPQLSVITNVGLDHIEILGTRVEKIAYEKAGIIKLKVPAVTGATGKALRVIEKVAEGKNAPLIKVDTQSVENTLKSDVIRNINLPIDIFRSTFYNFAFSNKLLALASVKALGVALGKGQISKAFGQTFPGRFEEIEKGVILDGAHNADKVRSLIEFIWRSKVKGQRSKVILVIAFKKGKDWKKMVDLLVKNLPVSKVIATKFYAVTDMGKHQAIDPKEIKSYIESKSQRVKVRVSNNSHEAVFEALQARGASSNLILITGSLYLVGEARTIWKLPDF